MEVNALRRRAGKLMQVFKKKILFFVEMADF